MAGLRYIHQATAINIDRQCHYPQYLHSTAMAHSSRRVQNTRRGKLPLCCLLHTGSKARGGNAIFGGTCLRRLGHDLYCYSVAQLESDVVNAVFEVDRGCGRYIQCWRADASGGICNHEVEDGWSRSRKKNHTPLYRVGQGSRKSRRQRSGVCAVHPTIELQRAQKQQQRKTEPNEADVDECHRRRRRRAKA